MFRKPKNYILDDEDYNALMDQAKTDRIVKYVIWWVALTLVFAFMGMPADKIGMFLGFILACMYGGGHANINEREAMKRISKVNRKVR